MYSSVGPFYRAYAHEALARAYGLVGDALLKEAHLSAAHELVEQVPVIEDRTPLLADLKTV
jgi:hypothetical protein